MSVSHASCSHDRTPKGRAACRAAAKRGLVCTCGGDTATDGPVLIHSHTCPLKPALKDVAKYDEPEAKPFPTNDMVCTKCGEVGTIHHYDCSTPFSDEELELAQRDLDREAEFQAIRDEMNKPKPVPATHNPLGSKVDGFARVRDWATVARDGGLPVKQTDEGDGCTLVTIGGPNGSASELRIGWDSGKRRTTATMKDVKVLPVKLTQVTILINSWVHAQV